MQRWTEARGAVRKKERSRGVGREREPGRKERRKEKAGSGAGESASCPHRFLFSVSPPLEVTAHLPLALLRCVVALISREAASCLVTDWEGVRNAVRA